MQIRYTPEEVAFFLYTFDQLPEILQHNLRSTEFKNSERLNWINNSIQNPLSADEAKLFLEMYDNIPDNLLFVLQISKRVPQDRLHWLYKMMEIESVFRPTEPSLDAPNTEEVDKFLQEALASVSSQEPASVLQPPQAPPSMQNPETANPTTPVASTSLSKDEIDLSRSPKKRKNQGLFQNPVAFLAPLQAKEEREEEEDSELKTSPRKKVK